MTRPEMAIGIFDSGLGGFTVMKAIETLMPHENILYFADTARVPYGNKSQETIIRYCLENIAFLKEQPLKLLIIACNTACSAAMPLIQQQLSIPVIGITEQAIAEVLSLVPTHRVAILGTRATIASNLYQDALTSRSPSIQLFPVACPLFVPLVEEGLVNHPAAHTMAKEYLCSLSDIDGVLFACTHYPFLSHIIQDLLPHTLLIDPSHACARKAHDLLSALNLLNRSPTIGSHQFFSTDSPEHFSTIGAQLLERPLETVQLV